MTNAIQQIDALLPQTQCRQCGYEDCLAYALALAENRADINLCAPGAEEVMFDLAHLLKRPTRTVMPHHPYLAKIRERECIGCTACLRACPVDAIVGARKWMHTVIATECTGCGLCIDACPVDCIDRQPENSRHLPQKPILATDNSLSPRFAAATHAKTRYQSHLQRYPKQKYAPTKPKPSTHTTTKPALDIAALLTKAQQQAKTHSKQGRVRTTNSQLRAEKLKQAIHASSYRQAQRDLRYGDDATKKAAIERLKTLGRDDTTEVADI